MKLLTDNKYLLEKFAGKGGWTYALIPEAVPDKENPFGWVHVSGTIDDYPFVKYRLMPMGEGRLFLPVNAEIRNAIGKRAGDYVHITLYPDAGPFEIPAELAQCLQEEPGAAAFFATLSDSERRYYIRWIFSAKKEQTRVDRLAATLEKLQRKEKFYSHLKEKKL